MRKSLLVIGILLLSLQVVSQSYKKLVEVGNKWNYYDGVSPTCGCPWDTKTYSLYFSTDTLLEGQIYKNVLCDIILQNSRSTVYAGALREETANQKVYVITPYSTKKLLYSFKQLEGDTISKDTSYYKDYVNIKTVKTIESYDFNGFTGKKITVKNINKRIDTGQISNYEDLIWYEGIGSMISLFDLSSIGYSNINTEELLCFSKNETTIYDNPNYPTCEYAFHVDDVKLIPDEQVQISPNPVKDILSIKTKKEIDRIELYNLSGVFILSTCSLKIDMSGLPSGTYIGKFYLESSAIETKKIIKY